MPYKIKKQKCTQSDGDKGSYVLSYTSKKGKKYNNCHTSKKKARGQIAAIEGPREGLEEINDLRDFVALCINHAHDPHDTRRKGLSNSNVDNIVKLQSHTTEPLPGNFVVNINPGCRHFRSVGKVISVNELPDGAGKTVGYETINHGPSWSKGSQLEKTLDQVAVVELSESLQYHIENNISLCENVFRPGSEEFFEVFIEARKLYKKNLYNPTTAFERELLEDQEVGEFDIYEGKVVPLDFPMLEEAKYKGKEVTLGAKGAKRTSDGKAYVYVRDPKTGKIKKVIFGSSMPDAMGDSEEHRKRRKSFGARHQCSDKKDKTKAGYWACRATKMFGRNIPGWW